MLLANEEPTFGPLQNSRTLKKIAGFSGSHDDNCDSSAVLDVPMRQVQKGNVYFVSSISSRVMNGTLVRLQSQLHTVSDTI